jgi:hypothetical protein
VPDAVRALPHTVRRACAETPQHPAVTHAVIKVTLDGEVT